MNETNEIGKPEAERLFGAAPWLGVWVVVSTSCADCGSKMAVRVLDHVPTDADKRKNETSIGGMWCISTCVVEAEMNGSPVIHDDA